MCVLMCPVCVCVCEGGRTGESEGEKMQSSACLSGHTIQHREKPFIQHSLPTPPMKLPSNSVRPEWTRWHGSVAIRPHHHHHPHPLQRTLFCRTFVCSSQLRPLSHSTHLPVLPEHSSSRIHFIHFCTRSFKMLLNCLYLSYFTVLP